MRSSSTAPPAARTCPFSHSIRWKPSSSSHQGRCYPAWARKSYPSRANGCSRSGRRTTQTRSSRRSSRRSGRTWTSRASVPRCRRSTCSWSRSAHPSSSATYARAQTVRTQSRAHLTQSELVTMDRFACAACGQVRSHMRLQQRLLVAERELTENCARWPAEGKLPVLLRDADQPSIRRSLARSRVHCIAWLGTGA